jgi:hypothetical protein
MVTKFRHHVSHVSGVAFALTLSHGTRDGRILVYRFFVGHFHGFSLDARRTGLLS